MPAQAAPPRFEPDEQCVPGPAIWQEPRCSGIIEGPEAPPSSTFLPPQPRPATWDEVCPTNQVERWREDCPALQVDTLPYRAARIRLPYPLPELPLAELTPKPDEEVVPFTFGYVRTLPLEIYRHPMEASAGLPPVRILYSGDQWVSIDGEIEYEGTRWYQINEGEFVRAETIALASPSRFQGVYLSQQPQYPFAWINRQTSPALVPHGAENPSAPLYQRYEVVTIYGQEYYGEEDMWYLIGPDQWVPQSNVSKVTVNPPPAGVAPGERWIEVDLFEQTLAAYEGERMVYATLISSGRPGSTWTDSGLFRIWYKVRAGKMSNPDVEDGSPAWYFLEDVPWTMYFNGATALHSAYWHDAFGFTRSHGCVNLAPRDAEWLFGWTSPYVPDGVKTLTANGNGTWVWVHNTPPWE